MARQRYVYPTDEIPHLWANQTQDSARNPQGNLFFEGDTIYSYGKHFVIAKLVEWKGERLCLLSEREYSSTTSRHQRQVESAVPHGVRKVRVDEPGRFWGPLTQRKVPGTAEDHDSYSWATFGEGGGKQYWKYEPIEPVLPNPDRMQYELKKREEKLKEVVGKLKLGRSPYYVDQLQMVYDEALGFVELFDQKRPEWLKLPEGLDAVREKLAARAEHDRLHPRRVVFGRTTWAYGQQLRQQADTVYQRLKLLPLDERVEAWRKGEYREVIDPPSVTVRDHDYLVRLVYLKLQGNEVVTSMGARFPEEHGRRAAMLIKALKDGGRLPYKREAEGATFRLGHYVVDRIEEDGTIWAGCHRVGWDQVEWFLAQIEQQEQAELIAVE